MNLLCLNTAFSEANVCLETNGQKFYKTLDANAKSSENVLPQIEEILTENNLRIADLDYIAVVVGTGSFTGTRIGVALAKGFMACNEKLKAVAINSLDLMAFEWTQKNKENGNFHCIQNALSGRFFIAKYSKNGDRIGDCILENNLPLKDKKIGLELENLTETDEKIKFNPENLVLYAENLIKKGEFTSKNNLSPIYLRLSQAEENLLKKGNK